MKAEQNQLLNLIADYQAAVAKAAAWLNARAIKEPGFQRQQEQPGCYAGYLDEARQIRYILHGAGCRVVGPDFEVDFDFAYADRCDGIKSWFLFDFLESNADIKRKYALLTGVDQLGQLLQELEREGVLIRNVGALDEHLYYLAADRHNPNPPAVILYAADL
jgi:hypothetical protein